MRWWAPLEPGKNREPNMPDYYGEFLDGFNNKITLHAVVNPEVKSKPYHRGEGFGVVKFKKSTREIIIECWPRNVDITLSESQQYNNWPIKINQTDNYNRAATGFLPKLKVDKPDQVVQVINEKTNEIIYTLRIKGHEFIPKVFAKGSYTIIVGEGNNQEIYKSNQSIETPSSLTIDVILNKP